MSYSSIFSTQKDCRCSLRFSASGKESVVHFKSIAELTANLSRHMGSGEVEISDSGTLVRVVSSTPYQASHNHWGATLAIDTKVEVIEAFGASGSVLKIRSLVERALKINKNQQKRHEPSVRATGSDAVYRGNGPIYGVRKSRGGPHYYRRMSTMGERRLNAMTLREEGEVAPRTARCSSNLPNNWDDYALDRQNGWKRQHKGIKSWDCQVTLSKKEKSRLAELNGVAK